MGLKPLVLFLSPESSDDVVTVSFSSNLYGKSRSSALRVFLERDLGAEVICYRYFSEIEDADLEKFKNLTERGCLALVIILETEFHPSLEDLENVREYISSSVSVVILAGMQFLEQTIVEKKDDPALVLPFFGSDTSFQIKKILADWRLSADFFDVRTSQDLEIVSSALQLAYEKNYLGEKEERCLAVPDFNGRVVAEALRLRLLPPECVEKEFDQVVLRELFVSEIAVVEENIYQQELRRLRQMNEEERKTFSVEVNAKFGLYPNGSGDFFSDRTVGFGSGVKGFALDSQYLIWVVTEGFGSHNVASVLLRCKVDCFCDFRGQELLEDCQKNILSGFVFDLDGWQTTFVYLEELEHEDQKTRERVLSFLSNSRRFLPIGREGPLLS